MTVDETVVDETGADELGINPVISRAKRRYSFPFVTPCIATGTCHEINSHMIFYGI